jgi:symplekin
VWTHPALWEGFIRCAKLIAPASYAALLQLPKEQLRDVVARQPSLKAGLREHVAKNARGNKARMAAYADIFGEDAPAPAPAAQGQEPPAAMQGQEATSVPAIPGQEPAPAAAS